MKTKALVSFLRTKHHGFTLVELIVVITILAILGTIAFTSLTGFSSTARDSSRTSDLANITQALGVHFAKTSTYPAPSNSFSVTYSGATVWNQGTVGDSVISTLDTSGNRLSRKPTDPVYNAEYTYSLLSTGKEYQLASVYEGTPPTVGYHIPHLTSPYPGEELVKSPSFQGGAGIFWIPQISAATAPVAYIKGTYNGVAAKVSTGSVTYVLAVPSIILADTGTLDLAVLSATSSPNWVMHNHASLPYSYKGLGLSLTGSSFSFVPTLPPTGSGLVVYASSSLPTDSSGALALANAIKSSYSGTILQTEPSIGSFMNTTTATDLINISKGLITNSLGGTTTTTPSQQGWGEVVASPLYVDDVFSAYTYTGFGGGGGSINNGIDLTGHGGLVWIKNRQSTYSNYLVDTVRGVGNYLSTDTTGGSLADGNGNNLTSFLSTGFNLSITTGGGLANALNEKYVSWTFRKAPKFFDVLTYTGDGTADRQIAHSLGVSPGMIIVKRTDGIGDWGVWHRGNGTTKYTYLSINSTSAAVSYAGNTQNGTGTPHSSTSFNPTDVYSVGMVNMNESGKTYIAYIFAHDTSTDGIIEAGSFTTDASGNASVNLGWEPQYVMMKSSSIAGTNWNIHDTMRGMPVWSATQYLMANLSNAEAWGGTSIVSPTATGFTTSNLGVSYTYVYLAIRRPNKPPTSGTEVYNAIARTGNGSTATVTGVGFAPDKVLVGVRVNNSGIAYTNTLVDRLRGQDGVRLWTNRTDAEWKDNTSVTNFTMDGMVLGIDSTVNNSSNQYINYFFKRATGFFDQVAYTGNGIARTISHNLSVAPELIITKARNNTEQWGAYSAPTGNTKYLIPNGNQVPQIGSYMWNNTDSTSTVFSLGDQYTNTNTYTYVAYLFATLPNISKVGSYTSDGTAKTIDAWFSGNAQGARFVLIKRTDQAGDWYVFDSTRGIIAWGNDPYLLLNSTAAEVTNTNYIEPNSAGFGLNASTPINTNGGSYIYLAIH